MLTALLPIAKQLGTAIGTAIIAAVIRKYEKSSIIAHFSKKIEDLTKDNSPQ